MKPLSTFIKKHINKIKNLKDLILLYLNDEYFKNTKDKWLKYLDDIESWCVDDYGDEKMALKKMTLNDFIEIIQLYGHLYKLDELTQR